MDLEQEIAFVGALEALERELRALFESMEAGMKESAARQYAAAPKIAAGTHQMVDVAYYADWNGNLKAPIVSIRCDAEGNLLVASFRLWRVSKKERPLCGAKCRDGHACRSRVVVRPDGSFAKRCRLHGGKSTGPKTPAGRARIAESNRRRAVLKNTEKPANSELQ